MAWTNIGNIKGPQGNAGSAATVAVGSVSTGSPGSSATVVNSGTSSAAVFEFSIPRGNVGPTGPTGPAGLGTVTPSTPSRTLGTSFQPNATKATLVTYTVRTQVTNPLLIGTSRAEVKLFSDAAATPTTERCRVAAESGVGITVTIALTTANEASLTYLVPAGHYVRMVSTVTGTGAASIVAQCEETLG